MYESFHGMSPDDPFHPDHRYSDRFRLSGNWVATDGGRKASGVPQGVGDCAARAVAVVTGRPYAKVCEELDALGEAETPCALHYAMSLYYSRTLGTTPRATSSARDGVRSDTLKRYMAGLGYEWVPTNHLGVVPKGRLGDLPKTGRLVVHGYNHVTALVNGVVHDTAPQSDNMLVLGYWVKKEV